MIDDLRLTLCDLRLDLRHAFQSSIVNRKSLLFFFGFQVFADLVNFALYGFMARFDQRQARGFLLRPFTGLASAFLRILDFGSFLGGAAVAERLAVLEVLFFIARILFAAGAA